MIYLVTGGSGSGKSTYAEQLMEQASGEKYYIATMQVRDEEGEQKVARHRKIRRNKGYVTIERPVDVGRIEIPRGDRSSALLECMSNLVANEMFAEGQIREPGPVTEKVVADVLRLGRQVERLVIVTNNVFEDGISYDPGTMAYLRALGAVNCRIADLADQVTEVVVGITVQIKEAVCPY